MIFLAMVGLNSHDKVCKAGSWRGWHMIYFKMFFKLFGSKPDTVGNSLLDNAVLPLYHFILLV